MAHAPVIRMSGNGTHPRQIARIARALRPLGTIPGWRRAVECLVPEHSGSFIVRNGQVSYAGDINSFIDRQVYLFGGYEAASIEKFISCVPIARRNIILDVGANAGTHSLAFARSFRTVHAFEPNRALWSQFERNVKLNKMNNVHLHRVGLGERDDEMILYTIHKLNYGLGTFVKSAQYDLPLQPSSRCEVRLGDSYLAALGIGTVDAIKVDVQGFEHEVLRGLEKTLERDRPIVWCEIGVGTLEKVASTRDLEILFRGPAHYFRFQAGAPCRRNSVKLQEVEGTLAPGDYVVVPVPGL